DVAGGVEVLGQLVDDVLVARRPGAARVDPLAVAVVGLVAGAPAVGLVGAGVRHGASDRSDRAPATGSPAAHRRGQASRILAHDVLSASGRTRVSATAVMKFESAPQRGSTWTCRWPGTPAPAASPRLVPTFMPSGASARLTATTASRTAAPSSAASSSVRSTSAATSRYGITSRWPRV